MEVFSVRQWKMTVLRFMDFASKHKGISDVWEEEPEGGGGRQDWSFSPSANQTARARVSARTHTHTAIGYSELTTLGHHICGAVAVLRLQIA